MTSRLNGLLFGTSFQTGVQFVLVDKVVVTDSVHILIEFIDERHRGGDIEARDFSLREGAEVFN